MEILIELNVIVSGSFFFFFFFFFEKTQTKDIPN